MKTADDFHTCDVADSMAAAAARLNVPLELIKQCKRQGSRAFRGSRIYLRPLAEMIAAMSEPDSFPFDIPMSPQSNPETVANFQEMLRTALRCGWLTTGEILEIILDQIIKAWGPKLRLKDFDKIIETVHNGFGCAVMLLEADPATDEFLKQSAAKLNRNAQEYSKQRIC